MKSQHYKDLITQARKQFLISSLSVLGLATKDPDITAQDMRNIYCYTRFVEEQDPINDTEPNEFTQ